MEDSFSWFYL